MIQFSTKRVPAIALRLQEKGSFDFCGKEKANDFSLTWGNQWTMLMLGFLLLPLTQTLKGQNTYLDPTTTAALLMYSDQLKNEQHKLTTRAENLRNAQLVVSGQLGVLSEIQNTMLLGLKEVSTTLQNGVQVKEILQDLNDCRQESQRIGNLVLEDPEYAVFGVKATARTYDSLLSMSQELSLLLEGGNLNLATAGDRYRLLYSLSQKVKTLKLWLFTISLNLERAKRLGFLRAVGPMQGYINTDKAIVESIVRRYKMVL